MITFLPDTFDWFQIIFAIFFGINFIVLKLLNGIEVYCLV